MITILLIASVFSAIGIILLVLFQQGKGDMGSAFGGGSQSMFGSRGSANFLSRLTSIMVSVFFLSSLGLAWVYAQQTERRSVVETTETNGAAQVQAIDGEVPVAPNVISTDGTQTNSTPGAVGVPGVPIVQGEGVKVIDVKTGAVNSADSLQNNIEASGEQLEAKINAELSESKSKLDAMIDGADNSVDKAVEKTVDAVKDATQ